MKHLGEEFVTSLLNAIVHFFYKENKSKYIVNQTALI